MIGSDPYTIEKMSIIRSNQNDIDATFLLVYDTLLVVARSPGVADEVEMGAEAS